MTTALRFWNDKLLFRSNALAFVDDCCCSGFSCDYCTGNAPASIQVDVTGVNNFTCSDCVAKFVGSHVLPGLTSCVWEKNFTLCIGGSATGTVRVQMVSSTGLSGILRVTSGIIVQQMSFVATVSGSCLNWSNVNFSYTSDIPGPYCGFPLGPYPTFVMSALP